MASEKTTTIIQRYLCALESGDDPDGLIRQLLERSAERLQNLCGKFLNRRYSRLKKPPLSLRPDNVLGGVVERLLKALRKVRPKTVRQFFALANQHIRWELNDLARQLDEEVNAVGIDSNAEEPPGSHDPNLTANERNILAAIEALPETEREVFELVRIQGLSHLEVAEQLEVTTKTIQRRLNRALLKLAETVQRPT